MKKDPWTSTRFEVPLTALLAVLTFFSGFAGCDNYGKILRDPALTRAFRNNQVDTAYAYYYLGRSSMPYAIAGIDRRYALDSKFWQLVDSGTDEFKKMVFWVWTDHNYEPHGAYILGPGGEKVGIYYSSIDRVAVKIDPSGKAVTLIPDKPYLRGGP